MSFAAYPVFRRPALSSRDILTHEHTLRELLSSFIPFGACRLYFPPAGADIRAEWLRAERSLLVPLRGGPDEGLLGVMSLQRVPAAKARQIVPLVEQIAALCVEQLRLRKSAVSDPVSGLANRECLLAAVEAEMELVRHSVYTGKDATPAGPENADMPTAAALTGYRAGFGLITLYFAGLRDAARRHGYDFADRLLGRLGAELLAESFDRALAGRTGSSECSVLVPDASAAACRSLAEAICARLAGVSAQCSVTGEVVGVRFGCGLAMFPADADPAATAFGPGEQVARLLRRARKAALVALESGAKTGPAAQQKGRAAQKGRAGQTGNRPTVMPFSRILAEGGHIVEMQPLSRLRASLGADVRAAEGQRFAVFGPGETGAGVYKGDIVLTTVADDDSIADILHLDDPATPMCQGDRLVLQTEIPENRPAPDTEIDPANGGSCTAAAAHTAALDQATGFFRHRDFLDRFMLASRAEPAFCLSLVRINLPTPATAPAACAHTAHDPAQHAENVVSRAASACRAAFGADILAGRYGFNSLILFHPGADSAALCTAYQQLAHRLHDEEHIETGIGIAPHPLLEFRKADALENSAHALKYALLLPFPHVGVLDSLGLTVHADSLLNQGDTFEAISVYKQALLADDDNETARNSLAVCLAGLGRLAEAEIHFLHVLDKSPRNAHALYNLGTVYQGLGDAARARAQFKSCLRHAPNHIFACLRLGQLAEADGNTRRARYWYKRAEQLPGGHAPTRRHFAALALKQGKTAEGRRLLYEALSHNPMDSAALGMLARLSIQEGEDPALAEALARQSVALRPENRQNWLTLAEALLAGGKQQEAYAARIRATPRQLSGLEKPGD